VGDEFGWAPRDIFCAIVYVPTLDAYVVNRLVILLAMRYRTEKRHTGSITGKDTWLKISQAPIWTTNELPILVSLDPEAMSPMPLLDGQRAIGFVRSLLAYW